MANFKVARMHVMNRGGLLAFVDLHFIGQGGVVLGKVSGFKLMNGTNGQFLGLPDQLKKGTTNEYQPTFFFGQDADSGEPLRKEALAIIQAAYLEKNAPAM